MTTTTKEKSSRFVCTSPREFDFGGGDDSDNKPAPQDATPAPQKPGKFQRYPNVTITDEWVIVEDVPVFDEHGEYKAKDLEHIIDNCNKRCEDTGDDCPIVIGHTQDEAPEDQQPEVVGFATKFRLGTIGKLAPRKAILATFRFLRDKWERAKQFPRRSIELWKDELYIDPISLLGATTPARDLGLMYARKGKVLRYSMENNLQATAIYGQGSPQEDLLRQVLSMLEQSDVWQWAQTQMDHDQQIAQTALESQEDPDEPVEEPDQALPPPEGQEQQPPVEEEANPQLEEEEDMDQVKDQEKLRMQKDQLSIEVEKFRKENEQVKAELEDLKRKFRRAERERDLIQLESEGYSFDRAEEMDVIQDMESETYQKHLARVRKCYAKGPVGVNLQPANVPEQGGEKQFTKHDMERAVKLCQQKGLSYEDALVAVRTN